MKTDGGPAFPMAGYTEMVEGRPHTLYAPMNGMTLRDYFAGHALAGYMANADLTRTKADVTAIECYHVADAMLAAREKKGVT